MLTSRGYLFPGCLGAVAINGVGGLEHEQSTLVNLRAGLGNGHTDSLLSQQERVSQLERCPNFRGKIEFYPNVLMS